MKIQVTSVHNEKAFECKICEKSFSNNQAMQIHVASVHEGKKLFKCEICDYSFSTKGNMNKHVESVHWEKKPFEHKIVV